MSINVAIDNDVLDNAKFVASKIDETYLRKRAYALGIAANATAKYLNANGLKTLSNHSLYRSAVFAKEVEIADIYANNARFDVRVTFNDTTFTVPKLHVKYDIKPQAYIVVKFDSTLKDISFLGFIPSEDLTFDKNGDEYYTYPLEILNPIEDFIPYAQKLDITPSKYSETDHENVKELCLSFLDEEASEADKIYFIKHVATCPVCRETFCDMNDFDDIVSQLKNYHELLNDSTLSVLSGNKKEVDQAVIANMAFVENAGEDLPDEEAIKLGGALPSASGALVSGEAASIIAQGALAAGAAEVVEEIGKELEPEILNLYDDQEEQQKEESSSEIEETLTDNNESLISEQEEIESLTEEDQEITPENNQTDVELSEQDNIALDDSNTEVENLVESDNLTEDDLEQLDEIDSINQESFDELNASIEAFASSPVEDLAETKEPLSEATDEEVTEDNLQADLETPIELEEVAEDNLQADLDSPIELEEVAEDNLQADLDAPIELEEVAEDNLQADLDSPVELEEVAEDNLQADLETHMEFEEVTEDNLQADLDAPIELEEVTEDNLQADLDTPMELEEVAEDNLQADLDAPMELEEIAEDNLQADLDTPMELEEVAEDNSQTNLDTNVELDDLHEEIKEEENDNINLEIENQELDNIEELNDDISLELEETTNDDTLNVSEDIILEEHNIEEDSFNNPNEQPETLEETSEQDLIGIESDKLNEDISEAKISLENNEPEDIHPIEEVEQLDELSDEILQENTTEKLSQNQEFEESQEADNSLEFEDLETIDELNEISELQEENNIPNDDATADFKIDEETTLEENRAEEFKENITTETNDYQDNNSTEFSSEVNTEFNEEQEISDMPPADEQTYFNENNTNSEQSQENSELQDLLDDDLLALLSDDDTQTQDNDSLNTQNSTEDLQEGIELTDEDYQQPESENPENGQTAENGEIENLFDEQNVPQDGEHVELDLSQEPMSAEAVKKTKKLAVAGALITLLAIGGAAGGFYMYQKNIAANNDSIDTAQDNQVFDFQNKGSEEEAADTSSAAVSQDINKSMTNSFSDKPAAISITKLSWQINEKLAVEPSVKEYLQTAGKNIQLNLQNDLANASDVAFNNSVKVSFEIAPDNTMKGIQVLESSGSDKIDAAITKSIKNTLKYVSVPKLKNYNSDYFLTLIINF